jgi:Spy/CpxP family protein refolding chaperone
MMRTGLNGGINEDFPDSIPGTGAPHEDKQAPLYPHLHQSNRSLPPAKRRSLQSGGTTKPPDHGHPDQRMEHKMNIHKNILPSLIFTSAIAFAIPVAAQAMSDGEHCEQHRMHGPMAHDEMPPLLHGVNLTEIQRDQIFNITHNQAPALREKATEARKAQAELRALSFSGNYDEAKAKTLAQNSARAMAEIAEMRAASANRIYLLLSPEQRKKIEELKHDVESREPRNRMKQRPHGERTAPRRTD